MRREQNQKRRERYSSLNNKKTLLKSLRDPWHVMTGYYCSHKQCHSIPPWALYQDVICRMTKLMVFLLNKFYFFTVTNEAWNVCHTLLFENSGRERHPRLLSQASIICMWPELTQLLFCVHVCNNAFQS